METSDNPLVPTLALSTELLDELEHAQSGQIFTSTAAEFKLHTTIFNGNVVTPAMAVVLPKDAKDVSAVVQFCVRHNLSPSVKSGGYGTAGWAINGDIVIDLQMLKGVDIEEPKSDGSYIALRDMLDPWSKGKDKARDTVTPSFSTSSFSPDTTSQFGSRKRERSPDVDIGGLPRNARVADFLVQTHGNSFDLPSPSIRRRIDPNGYFHPSRLSLEMTVPGISPVNSSESTDSNDTENSSTLDSAPSLNFSPPTSTEGEKQMDPPPEFDVRNTGADGNDPLPGGLQTQLQDHLPVDVTHREFRSVGGNSSSTEAHTQIARQSHVSNLPSLTSPNVGLRSEDPFGYLSSSTPRPSSSSVSHNPAAYVQPLYQRPLSHSFSLPGRSANDTIGLSTSRSNDVSHPLLSQLAASAASTDSYLTSAAVPVHAHAYVTFGAGVSQKEIDFYTDSNRLPAKGPDGSLCNVSYHVPLAAHPVGSSVMILGGFGFLSRLYGLSIDALVEAEVVLADGTITIVNAKENPDLWWAIRGAGPAFGIITRYKALAYPVPVVFAGNLIYNFHPATAVSLLKHFRDCIKSAPRELYANVLFTAGPAGKGSLAVVQICYVGPGEKGQEFLQAISSWDGEPCLLNEVSEKTFVSQQDSVAQILRGKAGRQWFIRSALITSLPDEVIHKSVLEFANTPIGCTWLFELAGGAVADADDTCIPKNQREAGFTVVAFHQWDLGDDDPLCVTTAEHWIYETLAPVACGGPYPAFFGRHETAHRIFGAYGEDNWARLCEIKKKYDPNGVFKNTFWPLGLDGSEIDPRTHEPPSP